MAKYTFRPMQQVIVFDDTHKGPYVAWIAKEVHYRTIRTIDKQVIIDISRHMEEAEKGVGRSIRAMHLRPYSNELWRACNEWHARMKKLQEDLKLIIRGKAPYEYLANSMFEFVPSKMLSQDDTESATRRPISEP